MSFIKEYWFQLATGFAFLSLFAYCQILASRLRGYKKMTRLLKGGALEEFINQLEKRIVGQQLAVEKNSKQIAGLHGKIAEFPQRWHLVRYNAFEKPGNDLSFSLALLNAAADGFVLTGIFAREDMRVYAKPITAGNSKYNLSEEEIAAIKKAMASK